MTIDEVIREARQWPADQVRELVDRLYETIDHDQIEASWRKEVRRRVAEIEAGTVTPIDGKEVTARMRKILGR
jgi:putative addiction module component (TIGR02574 family)